MTNIFKKTKVQENYLNKDFHQRSKIYSKLIKWPFENDKKENYNKLKTNVFMYQVADKTQRKHKNTVCQKTWKLEERVERK